MTGGVFVVLGGLLTFGLPLVLVIRELMARRRRKEEGGEGDGPAPALPKPPKYDWDQPLPDCLIPRRMTLAEIRELEDA